ncbi:hypothetical protein CDD83_11226 [Cordyceps sp. RAO-2017]|nr:hypothetical protein CDD83_11226 [Cordyceps sp. RAO-2017]
MPAPVPAPAQPALVPPPAPPPLPPQQPQAAPPPQQSQQQPAAPDTNNGQPAAHHHPHIAAAENVPSRVFKLQFDARKIVCCSQSPIIVGWDFCNGEAELEETAGFFATVD